MKFESVPFRARFMFRGKRYLKTAMSMPQDENRVGTIFQAEAEVEPIAEEETASGNERPG